jgi:hypothetical protein
MEWDPGHRVLCKPVKGLIHNDSCALGGKLNMGPRADGQSNIDAAATRPLVLFDHLINERILPAFLQQEGYVDPLERLTQPHRSPQGVVGIRRHVLRFEAITHNTAALRCGRILDRFPQIVARLTGMVDRFCTALDCVDTGFIPDQLLDTLPAPSQIGATRGGIDLNKPRTRAATQAEWRWPPRPPGSASKISPARCRR